MNADATTMIVRNQSTSPNMPDANAVIVLDNNTIQYTKAQDQSEEIVVDVSDNTSNCRLNEQLMFSLLSTETCQPFSANGR